MKAQKVRDLDENELRNQLKDMQEQMFRLQFQMNMGQTDGLKKLRGLKKDRARMLTILREREVAARLLEGQVAAAPSLVQTFIAYRGTTCAGLEAAEAAGFTAAVHAALEAATAKAAAMREQAARG